MADSTGGGECAGAVVDGGYNLIEDGSCITEASWSISGDPALLPLADNGGPTQTHLFLFASPARDRIPQGAVGCGQPIDQDQRGETRPVDGNCDIGAAESTNDAPTALDDERYAATDIQSIIDVLRNDSDAEGDVLTIVSVSDPPNGAAVIDNNRVLYTPDPGPAGSVDTFTYAVSDGQETRSAQVTVTTFQADLSGACTAADDLIAAINSANLDPDPDTITLAPDCTYSLTTYVDFNPDDYGPVGLPPVDSDITIVGNGAIIERAGNAENDFRLFYVTEDGDLTLERLHLRGGIAQGGNGIRFTGNTGSDGPGGHGGGAAGLGGAIFNRGSVTILESTLSDNHAKGGGGRGFVTRRQSA